VTPAAARRRAGAPDGLGPPAASAEANEPTTAAADRVGEAAGVGSLDPGPGAVAPMTGG
jgi:hypothetical protein